MSLWVKRRPDVSIHSIGQCFQEYLTKVKCHFWINFRRCRFIQHLVLTNFSLAASTIEAVKAEYCFFPAFFTLEVALVCFAHWDVRRNLLALSFSLWPSSSPDHRLSRAAIVIMWSQFKTMRKKKRESQKFWLW